MNVFSRIRSTIRGSFQGAKAGWKNTTSDFRAWAGRTFFGIDNSRLANNETIFSAITRLSNTISILPFKLYKNFEVQTDHNASLLLGYPNENMNGFDLINKLEVSRNEHGNAYAIIIRDIRMQPEAIIPFDSTYVTPFINTDDGVLWYQVQGVDGTYYVHNMNMIHVKHITGTSRWAGLSPLDVLKNSLDFDKAVREFSLSEMTKKESFKLTYETNVSEEKKGEVVDNFRQFYRENGGVLFQEPGVEITDLERKYIASDTFVSERITRARVANVFNMPVTFLNDSEGQSYSSNEQLMIQFINLTILPIVRQYELEFERKLLTDKDRRQGFRFKFSLGGLLRGDTATRQAFYQSGIRNGFLKQDEIRMFEELPPVGGNADKLWVSGDLYPIDLDPSERKGEKITVKEEDGNENG